MTKEIKHKSKRLNYDLRCDIIKAFIGKALKERRELLKDKENKLSIALYNDNFSKAKQELMASLPSGYLPKSNRFTVCFGQAVNGGVYVVELEQAVLVPYNVDENYRVPLKIYPESSKFYKEWEYLVKEQKDIRDKHNYLYNEIYVIVNSVNTTKQLIEAWPESKAVVLSICDIDYSPSSTSVPAVQISKINKELGL